MIAAVVDSGAIADPPGKPAHLVYCRVIGVVRPVPGSEIGFEVWLPLAGGWTGRLQMFGNGGYSSDLPRAQMLQGVARGSVVVAGRWPAAGRRLDKGASLR